MQAIEQAILEYTYQYTHAQSTQQGLSEMFYTFIVTSISTVITILATYGIASSSSVISFALSPITETFQEIFVDPYLEIIVTDIVAKLGGSTFWQVLISSLVEGLREAFFGSMSSLLLQGITRISHKNSVNTQNVQKNTRTTAIESLKSAMGQKESHIQNLIKPQYSSIIKTGASLILGAALIGIGGPMFFGATLACGFSAIQSIAGSFKTQKKRSLLLIKSYSIKQQEIQFIQMKMVLNTGYSHF